jgi:hypothetical protein
VAGENIQDGDDGVELDFLIDRATGKKMSKKKIL